MELRESVFRVSKSRYANISHHFGTPSVSHKWNSKKKKKNLTSTSQNIGYQFLVAALNFHLLFMKHWGGGGKVSFKYPANIVGKICPPWPTPTMSRILPHLVGALVQSPRDPNVPFQPRRFSVTVLSFSPRTTFKGHVKKHTGISLVI